MRNASARARSRGPSPRAGAGRRRAAPGAGRAAPRGAAAFATSSTRSRLGLRRLPHLEPVAEVLAHGHVRVERVALEHHRDVALARRGVGDVAAADRDRARRRLLEPGDQPQQRRLAAAGRADEDHELAVLDVQADVVDRAHAAAELLRDAVDDDLGHRRASSGLGPAAPSTRSLPATHDAAQLEPVVEDDDVGRAARRLATPSSSTGARARAGRRRGRGRDGVGRRGDAERVQVPDRLEHRRRRCRRGRRRAPRDAAVDADLDVAEPVAPVAGAGRGDRVGDERDPAGGAAAGRRAPSRARGGARRGSPARRRRRARAPRRRSPGSRWRSGRIALKRCVTVATPRSKAAAASSAVASVWPQRDDDRASGGGRSAPSAPRQLGRERHVGDQAALEQALEQVAVGVAARRRRRARRAARGERNGPSRWTPRIRAAPIAVGGTSRARDQVLLGRGDQGRLERGHAGLEQRLAGAAVAGRVGASEVDAAEAVHLQVDEAGRGDPAARAGASPTAATTPSAISTSPADSVAVDDRGLDAEPHSSSAAARRRRPPRAARAPRRRRGRRAARRSRPSPRRRRRGARRRPRRRRRRSPARPRAAPGAELRVARDDVDHQVPVRLAEADHRARSRSCSGRASAPCRPSSASSRRSPPGRRRRRPRGRRAPRAASLGARRRATTSAPAARGRRPPRRACTACRRSRRGGRPRRARGHAGGGDVARARLGVVLRRLLRLASAAAPPATIATTRPGGTPNVGPHSAASTSARRPGRAGADVDEPAAALEPRRDRVDRGGERAAPRTDGRTTARPRR